MLRAADPFTYQKPGPYRAGIHSDCNAVFRGLYEWLLECVPDSRERDEAITNLEQAAMWANKAIAFHVHELPSHDEIAK